MVSHRSECSSDRSCHKKEDRWDKMKLSEMGHLLRPAAKRIPVNPQFLSGQPPEDRFVHDIAMPALPRLFQQAVELFKPHSVIHAGGLLNVPAA